MSGHSKWSTIKHKKAAIDAKRGKMFTKVVKEITVAAREGSGDPESNPRLRLAISNARAINMPADNIERAIKKGTGELPGVQYESIVYEGYGPGGVAILMEVLTDNKNRTHPELRKIFEKRNGSLGTAGCVAWMFTRKGLLRVKKDQIDEDTLMNLVLEAGAEDIDSNDDELHIITCDINDFDRIKSSLEKAALAIQSSGLEMLPNSLMTVDAAQAKQVLGLIEDLDDHDDVQQVFSNIDIPEGLLKEAS